ncbi:DUF485 domain-containing protein [Streptomyces sp. R41]|uniref:DUF485 domain-containing protein n=1 Tax=Streptomyces sp. R41 TaxID=3238632 RepID=A0AB39R3H5_9ACTN
MTYADDNRYPQSAPTGWPQRRTEPYGHAPRHKSYERNPDPWQDDAYGYDASSFDAYGAYGQSPVHEQYAHETRPPGADLTALRSAYRLLRRVSTLTALGSFVVYVVLSCAAADLMGSKIAGELSLGMALGVLQLVVTFAAVFWYGRSAQRSVDPLARVVRERSVRARRDAGVAR